MGGACASLLCELKEQPVWLLVPVTAGRLALTVRARGGTWAEPITQHSRSVLWQSLHPVMGSVGAQINRVMAEQVRGEIQGHKLWVKSLSPVSSCGCPCRQPWPPFTKS